MLGAASPAGAAANDPPGYFSETGYRVGDAKFWQYFQARGGIRTFGYPVSRVFQLDGFKVQVFQRRVLQLGADGNVAQLNLLDQQYMPFTKFNNATFPAQDNALLATAPAPGSANYGQSILDYVIANAPDAINTLRPNFGQTFRTSVTMAEAYPRGGGNAGLLQGIWLEMWGVPTSKPAADPNNGNFVYVRFQRGIMHYDAGCSCTQGILLGDYFKSILTGKNLPADLADQAKASPYFQKYDNGQPSGVKAGQALANANLKDAFEPEPAAAAPGADVPVAAQPAAQPPAPGPGGLGGGPIRLGWQAHLYGQPQGRILGLIKQSGFGWVKQQVRWATHNPSDLDASVASANAAGVQVLASVVTTPPGLRGGKGESGPPDDFKQFGAFVGGLAARYKGKIAAYELWNEQNLVTEWSGRPINACEYVALLREGYNAVKAADPDAIVVSGALTPNGLNNPSIAIDDRNYLDQMYGCNNGEFLRIADAVGAHLAGFTNGPDDEPGKSTTGATNFIGHMSFYYKRIDDLYSVMKAHNDPRSMWITEYEWATAKPPVPKGYEWSTFLSEDQVSDFYARGIQMMRDSRPWVGAVFVWNLNFRTFQDYHVSETAIFGALNEDWSPRAIYNR
ncbi:MAG TPA: hypothetical protein VGL23_01180, partial [Chloroflexota bacterium]